MEIVSTENAQMWHWGDHDNLDDSQSVESTWLRVYTQNGEPYKGSICGELFLGYHSFKVCADYTLDRIRNANIWGAGSVHLYTLSGNNLIKSLSHDLKTKQAVNAINKALKEINENSSGA